jgi:hypothetical protein
MKNLTKKQIREKFWYDHPQFKNDFRKTYKQNDYTTDIRVSFTDFTWNLYQNGIITEKQLNDTTL